MKKMSLFSIIILFITAILLFIIIIIPDQKEIKTVEKEVEVEKYFNFGNFIIRDLEMVGDLEIYHIEKNLDMSYFKKGGTIPSFSITITAPMSIIDYKVESEYKHNVDFSFSLATKRISFMLFFYETGEKGDVVITFLNQSTGEIYQKREKIISQTP